LRIEWKSRLIKKDLCLTHQAIDKDNQCEDLIVRRVLMITTTNRKTSSEMVRFFYVHVFRTSADHVNYCFA